jgi:hypothetical protein
MTPTIDNQGLKNLRKNIFNVLDENLIFGRKKKKSFNLPPNTKIVDIFEILKLV